MEYIQEYTRWMNSLKVDENTKQEISSSSDKELQDCFYRNLEFGTGGLRGIMAAGTNRMNIYTVRKATQGLAEEILSHGTKFCKKGVAIAFDSRNNSKQFAYECANVLCANGIKTYIFDSLRPTPELSFAVRFLGCARGIVITASHNPKEYNGYKVYCEDGGQIPPEVADVIIKHINNIDIFDDIKLCDNPDYITIGKDVDKAYIDSVYCQSMGTLIPDDLKIVYTPIHGSGNLLVRRILNKIGAENVFVVPEQELPDGNFPTVNSPNPENPEAFALAIEYAKKINADLIFGTDPDSDRIGVVVKSSDGEFIVLNGNQTGCLLCEYILRKSKENKTLSQNSCVVKTIVTTEMVRKIADNYGAYTDDVLTGFKFIGEKIKEYELNGKRDFVFGLEESFGYLKGTYARDKDAVVAAMLICELCADYRARGLTLYDGLQSLYNNYGYYSQRLETITLKGIQGRQKIEKIMNYFRNERLSVDVVQKIDYKDGVGSLPRSDVLKFILPNGWFAVRPSGTEPKIKFYFDICGKDKSEADSRLDELTKLILNCSKTV